MAGQYQRTKLPIPDDYTPETDWNMGVFCYPDTPQWRGVVQGAFYELTRGRKWDESTGVILDAQAIARQIYGELEMGCKSDLARIADALEAANDDGKLSLDDVIQALTDDGTYKKIKPFLTAARTLLSWVPDVKVDPIQLLSLITQAIGVYNANRHAIEQTHLKQLDLLMTHDPPLSLFVDTIYGLLPDAGLTDSVTGDTDEYIMLTIQLFISLLTNSSTNERLTSIADAVAGRPDTQDELTSIAAAIAGLPDTQNELTSIAAAIAGRPDTQDELTSIAAAIAGLPDTQNELTSIAAAIAGLPDTQDELTAIANRLAPNGETVKDGLDAIANKIDFVGLIAQMRTCCYKNDITQSTPDATYGDCDAEKCRRIVLALGNVHAIYLASQSSVNGWEQKQVSWGSDITLSWMSDVIGDTLTSMSALISNRLTYAAGVIAGKEQSGELDDHIDTFISLMPSLLCAFYSNTKMGDAMDAARVIVTGSSMSQDEQDTVMDLLEGQYMLGVDIDAHPPKRGATAYFDSLEDYGVGDWYTGDCSECADCSDGSGGDGCSDCGDFGAVTLVDGLVLSAIYNSTTDRFEINAAFNDYYTFEWEVTAGVAYLNGHLECACGGMGANCCSSVMFYGSDGFDVTFSNVQVTTFNDCICA